MNFSLRIFNRLIVETQTTFSRNPTYGFLIHSIWVICFNILQNAKKWVKFHLHTLGDTLLCFMFDVSFIFGVSEKSKFLDISTYLGLNLYTQILLKSLNTVDSNIAVAMYFATSRNHFLNSFFITNVMFSNDSFYLLTRKSVTVNIILEVYNGLSENNVWDLA